MAIPSPSVDDWNLKVKRVLDLMGRRGYGCQRWFSPDLADYKYGLYREVGPNRGRVPVGVFDSIEELIAMCKLILASTEHDDER